MSFFSSLSNINLQTLKYLPTVAASAAAVEALAPDEASGLDKLNAAVGGATQALTSVDHPNPNVIAITTLVNLVVAVANILGAFVHKKPAA